MTLLCEAVHKSGNTRIKDAKRMHLLAFGGDARRAKVIKISFFLRVESYQDLHMAHIEGSDGARLLRQCVGFMIWP